MLYKQNKDMLVVVKTPKGSNLDAGDLKTDKKLNLNTEQG